MMSPRERSSDCIAPMAAVLHRRISFHQFWILLLLMVMLLAHLQKSHAVTLIVGDNDLTLSEAMEIAEAGDIVELQDGTYEERLESVRDGEIDNPITIIGNENTIIKATKSPAVRINHSHINLVGFTVDGFFGSSHDEDSYINKCVWIDGEVEDDVTPLQGFVMRDMLIQNCGSECLRLKNFVTGAIVTNNNMRNCGVYDYQLDDGEKNGEGIYIGTSINQWTYGVDECSYNYFSGNTIETNANECVDIKEGSTGNVVEHNICSNQLDEESGCFNSRGDANTFRFNIATACTGAGFRLGGSSGYGHSNNIYGNEIVNAEFGSLKIMADRQGLICDNFCEQGECKVRGSQATDVILAACFEVCDTIEFNSAMKTSSDLAIVSNDGN